MERRVKERLVGAAVLMATASILIPEMLSGPRREERATTAPSPGDPSLKTYTIDLNRSPGSATRTAVDERAPPQEASPVTTPLAQVPVSEAPEASPTEVIPEDTPPPVDSAPVERPEQRPVPDRVAERVSEAPARRTDTTTAPPAIASAPTAPTSRGWAVQLGSFSSRATADGMVKDLAQQGRNAFVMPVKSGTATLYRVRIGPFSNRGAAEAALRDVKVRVANAAVVAHP